MSNDDDVDLRYLQCESFLAEFQKPRVLTRNAFLPRMAVNLRPGFSGQFDLETIAAVLGAAANARPGQVIHACLIFQGKGALMHICSIEPEMICICADMGENLIRHFIGIARKARVNCTWLSQRIHIFGFHCLLARNHVSDPWASHHEWRPLCHTQPMPLSTRFSSGFLPTHALM